MFIGRKAELETLEKRYKSNKFEFGYVYGQRRIGKTMLLDEFGKDKKSIFLFASDSEDITIREDFTNAFYEQAGIKSTGYFSNWESFFEVLANYFGNDKGLIVIDEYPNIVIGRDGKRKKTDFVSKLQNAIDHLFIKTKVLFVITGSNISFMENEISNSKAPLYKRHSFELLISKFEWNDALEALKGMNDEDLIKTLCLTDTYPFYLSQIDTSLSFEENLKNLFFSRDSIFTSNPSSLISSNIIASGFYSSIMKNISSGNDTVKKLSEVLNSESAKISVYLDNLQKANSIRKHSVFNSKRLTYYRINDRMTAFYYKFIFSKEEQIKLGYGDAIFEKIKEQIDSFIHYSFENLCLSYLEYLNKNMKLNDYYESFQNYRVDNSKLGRSIEIDILGESDNNLMICECKMSKKKKDIDVFLSMQEDTSVPPFKGHNLIYYIFSTSGFTNELINFAKENSINLIDTKKLLLK